MPIWYRVLEVASMTLGTAASILTVLEGLKQRKHPKG